MKDISLYERVAPLEKNFPVKFSLHTGGCYLHWHEHLELLYYLSDGERVFCGDTTYDVRAGDLIIVNPGELHATYGGTFYCMRLSPAFFADVRFEKKGIGWLAVLLTAVCAVVAASLLCTFLPDIVRLMDNLILFFRG